MKQVFADALYWAALVKPRDPWRGPAKKARANLGQEVILVTPDEMLTEFATALSDGGPFLRKQAVKMVRAVLDDPNIRVFPQTRDSFKKGLERYAS